MQLKANARQAYDDRRLIAQHGPESAFCLYHANFDNGETGGCAIGVSLTAETIERVMGNDLSRTVTGRGWLGAPFRGTGRK
jgi:hypothetical protein